MFDGIGFLGYHDDIDALLPLPHHSHDTDEQVELGISMVLTWDFRPQSILIWIYLRQPN